MDEVTNVCLVGPLEQLEALVKSVDEKVKASAITYSTVVPVPEDPASQPQSWQTRRFEMVVSFAGGGEAGSVYNLIRDEVLKRSGNGVEEKKSHRDP
jgi:hypothetical protein